MIDILDLVIIINMIIGVDDINMIADVNSDGIIDILDIVIIISWIVADDFE